MSEPPSDNDFTLPDRCGASVAHDLAEAGRAVPPGGRFGIGATGVARMSCAVVVVLVSISRSLAQSGGSLVIRAPSRAVTDAFSELGLFESLMSMEFAE